MTRDKFILLLLISLIVTSACQSNKKAESVSFDQTITTSNLEVFDIPPVLFKERTIFCTDDFFISNSVTPDTLFRVFDNKSLEYLGGFGTQGQGPEEYNVIASSLFSPYGNAIHVGNFKTVRTVELKKREMNSSELDISVVEEHRTPGELVPLNWSFKLNDSSFVGEKAFSLDSELAYFNIQNGVTGEFISFPEFVDDITPKAKSLVYNKKLRVSRDESKIVMAYSRFPLIRIYDVVSGQIKNVFVKTDSKFEQNEIKMNPDKLNINYKELFNYYINLEVTEKFIYAQMLIMSWDNDLAKSKLHYPSELHVFNLNGEPKLKITLEDWMHTYAPSMDDQYIYFWNAEIEDKVYRLPISESL